MVTNHVASDLSLMGSASWLGSVSREAHYHLIRLLQVWDQLIHLIDHALWEIVDVISRFYLGIVDVDVDLLGDLSVGEPQFCIPTSA